MAGSGLGMGVTALHVILAASLLTLVVCAAAIPQMQGKEGVVAAESSITSGAEKYIPPQISPNGISRMKRYIGWGRRPGMRYSKATSAFDWDNQFNKIYNKYEKRGQTGPESPISSFRELKMKQKVPNILNLLPHLSLQRNSRSEVDDFGNEDLTDINDALMILLEEAQNRNSEQ